MQLALTQSSVVKQVTEQEAGTILAPCVAVIPGVLNKHLLPASVLAASVELWNGIPVTVDHPPEDAGLEWIEQPGNRIGEICNAEIRDDGALLVSIKFDSPPPPGDGTKIVEAIVGNSMLEVSTGYRATVAEDPGTVNGFPFTWVARSITPWHLAIFADETVGACSVKAGCGTPRVNAEENKMDPTKEPVSNELDMMDRSRLVVDAIIDANGNGDDFAAFPSDIRVFDDLAWYQINQTRFEISYKINESGDEPVVELGDPTPGDLEFVARNASGQPNGWKRMWKALFGETEEDVQAAAEANAKEKQDMDTKETMALLQKRHSLSDEDIVALKDVPPCLLEKFAAKQEPVQNAQADAGTTANVSTTMGQTTATPAPLTEDQMAQASPAFAAFLKQQSQEQDDTLNAVGIDPKDLADVPAAARLKLVEALSSKKTATPDYSGQGQPLNIADAINADIKNSTPEEVDITKLPRPASGWCPGQEKVN